MRFQNGIYSVYLKLTVYLFVNDYSLLLLFAHTQKQTRIEFETVQRVCLRSAISIRFTVILNLIHIESDFHRTNMQLFIAHCIRLHMKSIISTEIVL